MGCVRVENEASDPWMLQPARSTLVCPPARSTLVSCSTLPELSTAERKAWKMDLESALCRKLSAVSASRVPALLEQRWKTRKFSVPSDFPRMQSEMTEMPASGPTKCRDDDDDDDDDYEEYPYEYVTCGCGNETGHSEL